MAKAGMKKDAKKRWYRAEVDGDHDTWSHAQHVLDEATVTGYGGEGAAVACPDAFASLRKEACAVEPLTFYPKYADEDEGNHSLLLPDRYQDLGCIGRGGMGEVRRVLDKSLHRTVAMKLLRQEVLGKVENSLRFLEEAQVTSQLEHPSIIPVYDVGKLPDGRSYFTMREVSGKTFKAVIKEVHQRASHNAWNPSDSKWTFRGLIESLMRVCQAVEYAHTRGVIHQDLKPSNIMVGDYGEVLVLDWGIASLRPNLAQLGQPLYQPVVTDVPAPKGDGNQLVVGTPAYMAPEQARGEGAGFDIAADIYALGAIFYCILSGRPPYRRQGEVDILSQLLSGPPPTPERLYVPDGAALRSEEGGDPLLPEQLVGICQWAMARNPKHRPKRAGDLANALEKWLNGAMRRDEAAKVVHGVAKLRERVLRIEGEIRETQGNIQALDGDYAGDFAHARKEKRWALEDRMARLQRSVRLKELMYLEGLRSALTLDPDHVEAHELMADFYFHKHKDAEARRDEMTASECELLLRSHDRRRKYGDYLAGDGQFSLHATLPNAEAVLYRYSLMGRRLQLKRVLELGTLPIDDQLLPQGSYLLELSAPGHITTRYPFMVERCGQWNATKGPDGDPEPVRLLPTGLFSADEIFIPGGWYRSGGDPQAMNALPARNIWVDDFVMQKFPVSHFQYLAFINVLAAQGREAEVQAYVPRAHSEQGRSMGPLLYVQTASGAYKFPDRHMGGRAVTGVTWHGAMAYAQWYSQKTGRHWRLPGELEWEKAARGVDGRYYPWGDHFDADWACMRESHRGEPDCPDLKSYPEDCSPYGVRGLAGNVADWCLDAFSKDGPPLDCGHYRAPLEHCDRFLGGDPGLQGSSPDGQVPAVLRGGSWYCEAPFLRAAHRFGFVPPLKYVGFRLVTSDLVDT